MRNVMNQPIVALENVSRIYTQGELQVRAVNALDLQVQSGEFTVLSGPSGSGKTTILNLIGGLDTPTSGKILLEGKNTAELDDLYDHDMMEDTLLVAMGEFGRTPKISNRAAREHHNKCYFSIWAGAGIEPGRCIGESDEKGERPVTRPITPLMAGTTIAELCGVGAQQRAELKVLDGGSVIEELL